MTEILNAPDVKDSYTISADWLEILCLLRNDHRATDADIAHSHEILDDRAAPPPADIEVDGLDPDIVDAEFERALDALFNELGTRADALGALYPFTLSVAPRRLQLTLADESQDDAVRNGRSIYIACLIMSAIRSGVIGARTAGIQIDPIMGNIFQICATLAAAGYLRGDAYWFGHPRPDETPMLDAIRELTRLIGSGKAKNARPAGEAVFAKDGGIDVVAWRDHHDGRPAKIILYGQCASGMNWDGKPVSKKVDRLDGYYDTRISKHWTPALFTPFPLYMSKESSYRLWTDEDRIGFYLAHEAEMGVIIDRLRIVNWSVEALGNIRPSAQNAADRLGELFSWAENAIDLARVGIA